MADKKVAIGLGAVAIIGGIILLARKAEAKPPGPPRFATLTGSVTDSDTGGSIEFASVSLNGLKTVTGSDGFYVIEDIQIWETQRTFTLTVKKQGYQTFRTTVMLMPDFNEFSVELER